jgi:hypothetical protein
MASRVSQQADWRGRWENEVVMSSAFAFADDPPGIDRFHTVDAHAPGRARHEPSLRLVPFDKFERLFRFEFV